MPTIYAVIMAGGRGERFWPLSTPQCPKQFLTLFGGRALLTQAVERLEGLVPAERTLVITAADLAGLARAAAPALAPENIIGEPCGRDTAAACALACALVERRDPDAVVCILTADQIMGDAAAFRATLADAATVAAAGDVIVTLGIVPTAPATGFGYIRAGQDIGAPTATCFARVERFVEKPGLETARRYLAEGCYFWNAGMFVWRTSVMRRALARFAPALDKMCGRLAAAPAGMASVQDLTREIYPQLPRISIDYAVMEHADNLVVARGDFGWDDVGSWDSAAVHLPQRDDGNAVVGECHALDAGGNVVVAADGQKIALLGVSGLVVVQGNGITLVCGRERAQDVKKLLQQVSGGV